MRILRFHCLLAAIFVLLFVEHTSAQTVQDAVSAVENHYSALIDLTAKVVQKNVLASIGKTQKFEGTLFIKKPGRLRLDFTNGQVILVEGRSALFYSRKNAQVIKKSFTAVEHMNIPVAFLLGAARIRDDFDVLQPDPKAPRSIELLPRKPGSAMKKLLIKSDDEGRIRELLIYDKSGNVSELIFSEIREGSGIADAQFVFIAPEGTEIIEQ